MDIFAMTILTGETPVPQKSDPPFAIHSPHASLRLCVKVTLPATLPTETQPHPAGLRNGRFLALEMQEVRGWVEEHKRIKTPMRQISKNSLAIIHGHVPASRAAARDKKKSQS